MYIGVARVRRLGLFKLVDGLVVFPSSRQCRNEAESCALLVRLDGKGTPVLVFGKFVFPLAVIDIGQLLVEGGIGGIGLERLPVVVGRQGVVLADSEYLCQP